MPILKRILVATDLSATGYWAVMRAGQLARQWEASLLLVHARPDWNLLARWPSVSADSHQDVARATDKALRELMADLEARFGVHCRCDLRTGRASNVIAAAVAEYEPYLVVIGARGEHDSDEAVPCLGGTAFELLTRFEQPLLLVRRAAATPYTTSLVAVDAVSPLSRRIVLWGSGLVQSGDCHVVQAYDLPYVERMRFSGVSEAVIDRERRQAREETIATVREVLGSAEGAACVQMDAVLGEPVTALLAAIKRHSAELVTVGKRAPSTPHLQHGAIGRVALRIAYHAPVDVLIVSSRGNPLGG